MSRGLLFSRYSVVLANTCTHKPTHIFVPGKIGPNCTTKNVFLIFKQSYGLILIVTTAAVVLTNILRYLAQTSPTAPLNPGPQTTSTVPLDLVRDSRG